MRSAVAGTQTRRSEVRSARRAQARPGVPRSWFFRAPGETPTALWIAAIHALAIGGIVALPLPDWPFLIVAAALYALGGLGTTLAYHRALAHRSFKLHGGVERALVLLAMFNGSGDPLSWVANHRHHHAHSDTDLDVSSPGNGGFWYAHLRWLWQAPAADPQRYCPDLVGRGYRRFREWQPAILVLSLCGALTLAPFVGWPAALAGACWLGPIRLVAALHVQCSVNSFCHWGPRLAHGSAKNIAWLTPFHLGQGENWHANHHRSPRAPRLGLHWWQLDLGWWVIELLRRLGLAELRR